MILAVGGCSFSDYRKGIVPYGKQVADYFDYSYLHAAACAGSNHRIWRVLSRAIIDGDLSRGDLILLQYTILDRKEVWSPDPVRFYSPNEELDDAWHPGKIFRLTAHSAEYSQNRHEKKYSDLHNRFTNHKFNREVFETQHAAFRALCDVNGIQCININTVYDQSHRITGINLESILQDSLLRLDSGHMNQSGHNKATTKIIEHLNQAIDSN
jgi:hypothetical protein